METRETASEAPAWARDGLPVEPPPHVFVKARGILIRADGDDGSPWNVVSPDGEGHVYWKGDNAALARNWRPCWSDLSDACPLALVVQGGPFGGHRLMLRIGSAGRGHNFVVSPEMQRARAEGLAVEGHRLFTRFAEQPSQDVAETSGSGGGGEPYDPALDPEWARAMAAQEDEIGSIVPGGAQGGVVARHRRAIDEERRLRLPAAERPWLESKAQPPRPLVEIMGAVLHELRTSGPHGLHVEELVERIGGRLIDKAVATLSDEGRVVVRHGLVRMSEAQREIGELRDAMVAPRLVEEHLFIASRALETVRSALRCPDGADVVEHARETMREADGARCLVAIIREKRDVFEQDAEAWRSVASNLTDALTVALKSREDHPSAASDGGEVRSRVTLAHRLAHLAEARVLSLDAPTKDPYALGLQDASWIAAAGGDIEPRLPVVAVRLNDGTFVRCVVLGAVPACGGFLLSSPFTGRPLVSLDGVVRPVDRMSAVVGALHPDDLAALRCDGGAAFPGAQPEGR